MCTVGSVAAYFTKQVVLGGFSLFLCVAISFEYLNSNDEKIQEVKLRDRKRLLDYLQNMQYGYAI